MTEFCRRRAIYAQHRQSVIDPSVTAGSGPAVETPPVSPDLTPATDPVSNAPKKRGRPKGSKNRPKS